MNGEPLTDEQREHARVLCLALTQARDLPPSALVSCFALHLVETMTPHSRASFVASIRRRFPEAFADWQDPTLPETIHAPDRFVAFDKPEPLATLGALVLEHGMLVHTAADGRTTGQPAKRYPDGRIERLTYPICFYCMGSGTLSPDRGGDHKWRCRACGGSGTPPSGQQPPAGVNPAAFARYAAQCQEWQAIRDELITAAGGEPVTAYQVTLEQKKRLMARGDRMVTPEELEERQP